jgi:hypothetical protein
MDALHWGGYKKKTMDLQFLQDSARRELQFQQKPQNASQVRLYYSNTAQFIHTPHPTNHTHLHSNTLYYSYAPHLMHPFVVNIGPVTYYTHCIVHHILVIYIMHFHIFHKTDRTSTLFLSCVHDICNEMMVYVEYVIGTRGRVQRSSKDARDVVYWSEDEYEL